MPPIFGCSRTAPQRSGRLRHKRAGRAGTGKGRAVERWSRRRHHAVRRLQLEPLERRALLAAIGNLVWQDADGDGVQLVSESGVPGAVVELLDAGGVSQGVRITGGSGGYAFGGVPAGDYRLEVRLPVGFGHTLADVGDDSLDSDINPATGRSDLFSVGASDDATRDAGLTGAAPDFGFALRAGNVSQDQGRAVAVDGAGNAYVTGSFTGQVDFDSGPGVWNLSSLGGEDIFVAKYTSTGALVWAQALGGAGANDQGLGIAVTAAGEVVATGRFSATVDFDPSSGGTSELTSADGDDAFAVKLDSNGGLVWARRIGGDGQEQGLDVALDATGGVYLTGRFDGVVDFDPGIGEMPLDAGSSDSAFFLKLNSAGDFVWARSAQGGTEASHGQAISVDGLGQVFATGLFGGTVSFGGASLVSHGGTDIFVTRLDENGDFVWTRGFGGGQSEQVGGIAIDPFGNVIVAGDFQQSVDFDPTGGVHNLSAVAGKDAFISKLDRQGSFLWARTYGGGGAEQATGLAADNNGNLYVTGRYHGSVDFDPGFGTDVLASAGASDIFVAKLDAFGNHVKALSVGGEGADESLAIAVDSLGRPFITGYFGTPPNTPADFDPGLSVFGLESAGGDDMFLARLMIEGTENSAPVVVPIGIIIIIDEDTPTTIELDDWVNGGPETTTITDIDAADPIGGIAVIMTVGQGIFSYSLDGSTFMDVGSVSDSQALLLPSDVDIRYTPTMLQGETAELTYRAWDGTLGTVGQKVDASVFGGQQAFSLLTETITFDVGDLNDAPVLLPAGSTVATDEDTVLEFSVADLSNGAIADTGISDADVGDPVGGIALTDIEGFGLVSFSLNGTNFTQVNSVNETNALLLPASAVIRYTPQGDVGNLASISYRAWDGTQGVAGGRENAATHGGTTAFSQAMDRLRIDVADVNDAPLLDPADPVRSTSEDDPLVLPVTSFINAGPMSTGVADVDTGGEFPGIAVVGTTGNGTWEYSVDSLDFELVGAVSEASALLLPLRATLRYSPDSANGEVASLTYRAWDLTQGDPEQHFNITVHGGTSAFSSNLDTLWINVSGLNDPPNDITLGNLTVAENAEAAVVGAVSVVDPDRNDTFSFLVSDNRFEVSGGQLRLKAGQSLDHEAAPQISLSITATDSGNLSVNRSFTLDVLDLNEPPTDLALGNLSVDENDSGAIVGLLSVTDPDEEDTHAFLVSDVRFEAVGGQLKLKDGQSLDHESEPTVRVTISAKDSGELTIVREFELQVNDVNEAPTGLALDANTVLENQPGAVIGMLSATDPDANQQHVFTVNDARFEVVGGQLKLRPTESLDFESQPQVTLDITATDNGSPARDLTVSVTIEVVNVNEPPTAVQLQSDSIDENVAGGIIGNLLVTDPETRDEHTFEVVADDRFEVLSGQLRLKSGISLDHEAEPTVDVVLTVTDDGQPSRHGTLTVTVQVGDVNEAPQLVAPLPNEHGMSNRPLSITIGAGAFFDVDENDQLTFTARSFDGSPLPGWLGFDTSSLTFSGTPSIYDPGQYVITVTVHDQGNLTADGTFMLDVQAAPAPWQHPFNPLDVNGDNIVSPVDILIVINYINNHPSDPNLPFMPVAPPPFYDVNGDNLATPADILFIVNFLNAGGTAEGESAGSAVGDAGHVLGHQPALVIGAPGLAAEAIWPLDSGQYAARPISRRAAAVLATESDIPLAAPARRTVWESLGDAELELPELNTGSVLERAVEQLAELVAPRTP